MNHTRRVKIIRKSQTQPCVRCPATNLITFQCWNCELFVSGYENGDIKCAYPSEFPLNLDFMRVEPDTSRWDAKYHLRKQDVVCGHPALYEFGEIYDCEIGRVWDTWVRDKSKLKSRPHGTISPIP